MRWLVTLMIAGLMTGCSSSQAPPKNQMANYFGVQTEHRQNVQPLPDLPRSRNSNVDNVEGTVLTAALSFLSSNGTNPNEFISGRCSCHSAGDIGFELPCLNVAITLQDEAGKPLDRLLSSDGEFMFKVDTSKRYQIAIDPNRYLLLGSPKLLKGGDTIVLKLSPKKASE